MAKKENSEIELKIRVPKALMEKINDFRHSQKLDSKKQAVVHVLEAFFSKETRPVDTLDEKGKTVSADDAPAISVEHAAA